MPGWKTSTRNIRKIADLPAEARAYLRVIEQAVGVPVRYVGVGPEREQLAI
jgi:adenylosuccinate synthase